MIQDIADEEILAACSDAKTVTLKPGDTLFREGDDARSMYVVKQGTLRILSGSTIPSSAPTRYACGRQCLLGRLLMISSTMAALKT